MSKFDQIKEVKGLLAGLIAMLTVFSVIGLALMDWRVSVHVTSAVDNAFVNNLAGSLKIVSMDTNIASNTRTGDENAEDIEQNRRNNELAMFRLLGLPPPADSTP